MKKQNNWRIYAVLGLFFLFGAAIISRLFFLQIMERKLFQAQALGQQTGIFDVKGERGQIFCQNNNGGTKPLAINRDNWTLTASLADVQDKDTFAEKLSKITDLKKEEILSKLDGQDAYVTLAKDVSNEQLDKIKALNLAGLYWQNNPSRFYPQGNFLSQTLGFLGGEGAGQYGIEGYYDNELQGKSGIVEQKSGLASILSSDSQVSLDGSNLYLTVDYNIQFQAEALLKKAQQKLSMEAGQIIVLKPDSGKILALAKKTWEFSKMAQYRSFLSPAQL